MCFLVVPGKFFVATLCANVFLWIGFVHAPCSSWYSIDSQHVHSDVLQFNAVSISVVRACSVAMVLVGRCFWFAWCVSANFTNVCTCRCARYNSCLYFVAANILLVTLTHLVVFASVLVHLIESDYQIHTCLHKSYAPVRSGAASRARTISSTSKFICSQISSFA